MVWDSAQYAVFAGHRGRPFADLLARIDARAPAVVVDLGCGDGPLTLGLARRWPDARIVGVDSSLEMLAAARALDSTGRVEWVEARIEDWTPADVGAPVDVLVTNAALQWVPHHLDLIPRWVEALAPGGWFGLQVPDNFQAPSHALMREVAARHPRAADLLPRLQRALGVAAPEDYLAVLADLGRPPDVWVTEYQHILDPVGAQRSPVLEWVRATGLRPVLEMLTDEDERRLFLEDYVRELDAAYPRHRWGVVLGFRRIFAVARRLG
jgi:trans-aconitate 2-methyltransferase